MLGVLVARRLWFDSEGDTMKSGIAGLLVLVGLGMLIFSLFVGNKVSADQEWSEDKIQEFSQLTKDIHVPSRDPVDNTKKKERLVEMQQELLDVKDGADSKKMMLYWPGLGLTVVGICLQLWAWLDKKRSA